MSASENSILLEVIIKVNGCSAGSIVLKFDLEHGSESVLELAAQNINEAETVLDEERGLSMNVLEFAEIIVTNGPTASPSSSISDADSATDDSTGSTTIIIVFVVLFVIIVALVLLVVVLYKRGQKKSFNETQKNMAMEMGSMSASNSPRSPNSKDGMLETQMMDVAENDDTEDMYPGKESIAAKSQEQVMQEIMNGNANTAGGPEV